MAVDTENRRFSMLALGLPHVAAHVFATPDGTIIAEDRGQLIGLYPGISLLAGHPMWQRWGGSIWPPLGPMRWGRGWTWG